MTVKVTKHTPPPVQPDETYTLEGLTEAHMKLLRTYVLHTRVPDSLADLELDFLAATDEFCGNGYLADGDLEVQEP